MATGADSLELTINAGAGAGGYIGKLAEKVGSPGPALKVIGQTILDEFVTPSFTKQQSPEGAAWPPLARSTLKGTVPGTNARRRSTYGHRALVRMGQLRSSFNSRVDTDGKRVRIGTPFDFFKYHQHWPENQSLDKGIMPTRAALPTPQANGKLHPTIMNATTTILEEWLTDLEGGNP